jgi:hypothetical protein
MDFKIYNLLVFYSGSQKMQQRLPPHSWTRETVLRDRTTVQVSKSSSGDFFCVPIKTKNIFFEGSFGELIGTAVPPQ